MYKSTSESFKNTIHSEKYSILSELLKPLPSPELLKVAVENFEFYSKIISSPELLKVWDSTIDLYQCLDIAQLNTVNKQIDSLPKIDFQQIKDTVYENRSKIYYYAATANTTIMPSRLKAGMPSRVENPISSSIEQSDSLTSEQTDSSSDRTTVRINNRTIVFANNRTTDSFNDETTDSSTFEQSDQYNNDETIIMSEQVAELVNIVDDSAEFPQPDSDKQIHIRNLDKSYESIKNILFAIIFSIALPLYNTYQNETTSSLLQKNHSKQMQAINKQTKELKQHTKALKQLTREIQKQTKEMQKQNELLEKILSSNDASVSSSTPSTTHKD